MIFARYIELNEDKSPKADSLGHWRELPKDKLGSAANVGGVIAENVVLIDFDKAEQGEAFLKLVKVCNYKTLCIKTDRGYHFYFRNKDKTLKNGSHLLNGLGLEFDIKVGGRNTYAMVKRCGKLRPTIYGEGELEELPYFCKKIKQLKPGEESPLFGLKEGEGRNCQLSKWKLILNNNGYTADKIAECLGLINDFVLGEPLGERELETLQRDESESEIFREGFNTASKKTYNNFKREKREERQEEEEEKTEGRCQGKREDRKQFLFNFALALVEKYHIKKIEGLTGDLLYFYTTNYYKLYSNKDLLKSTILIEGLAIEEHLTSGEVDNIIIPWIKATAERISLEEEERKGEVYLATNNKLIIYKGLDFQIVDPSPSYFCTVKLDVDYKEETQRTEVDTFLNDIANGDEETERLLKELIGYCLFPKNILRKSFFLVGNGGNGKSTFLDLLTAFLGRRNTSHTNLWDLENNRFATANLKDKLANLGDDINSDDFSKLSNFKTITSGDTLLAEFKREQAFSFNPFCKLIFSCNIAPLLRENTEGIKSRVILVPFEKSFIKNGKIEKPNYLQNINNSENFSRLLDIGLKSLKELLERGYFIEGKKGRAKAEEVLRESDIVYSFALDYEAQGKSFDGEVIGGCYRAFVNYMKEFAPRLQPITANMFSRRIRGLYEGMISKKKMFGDGKVRAIFHAEKKLESLTEREVLRETKEQEEREEEEERKREEELEREKKKEERAEETKDFIEDYIKELNVYEWYDDHFYIAFNKYQNKKEQEGKGEDVENKEEFVKEFKKTLKEQGAFKTKDYTEGTVWILPQSKLFEKYKNKK